MPDKPRPRDPFCDPRRLCFFVFFFIKFPSPRNAQKDELIRKQSQSRHRNELPIILILETSVSLACQTANVGQRFSRNWTACCYQISRNLSDTMPSVSVVRCWWLPVVVHEVACGKRSGNTRMLAVLLKAFNRCCAVWVCAPIFCFALIFVVREIEHT